MSLSQTSYLALLKGIDDLGKLYGGDVAATMFHVVCRLKLSLQLITPTDKTLCLNR